MSSTGNEKPTGVPFLSRWSRKKTDASVAPTETGGAAILPGAKSQNPSTGAPYKAIAPETPPPEPGSAPEAVEKQALPPIDSLTPDADFSPFMAKDVDPALRNQAMKKLFTDPHYGFDNMDKLDIYIDDYSKPDPIPLEMLKMMYQSKSLFLFEEEEKKEAEAAAAPTLPGEVPVEAEPPVAIQADTNVLKPPAPVVDDRKAATAEISHIEPKRISSTE